MSNQTRYALEQSRADADLLTRLFEKADQVLIKKLSNNDRLWAHQKIDENGDPVPGKRENNQAGVYIPQEVRDGGFFPPLQLREREKGKAEIREILFDTDWPQSYEKKKSRLANYRSKGEETHITRLPRPLFIDLLPASFLVMGRIRNCGEYLYECMTIDSASDEATLLAGMFGFDSDFVVGVFEPASVKAEEREKVLDFAEQVIAAWKAGLIEKFAADNAAMPTTTELARKALAAFLTKYGLDTINPFVLDKPGDALREISRSIEWDLFREYQRRERSVELIRLTLGDKPRTMEATAIIRQLIEQLPAIDALMLSAAQQRKARAGYSYEHHIEAMLKGGSIPFQKQVVLASKKRPDFILPSLAYVDSGDPNARTGLILSAKTTLRERWKQVEREMGGRRLFFATVDENISGSAIEDMASIGVHLVVPESMKSSIKKRGASEERFTEYSKHSNVLTFAEFCCNELKPHLTTWQSGIL